MRTSCSWITFIGIASIGIAGLLLAPSPQLARAETFAMSAGKQILPGRFCYHFGAIAGDDVGAFKDAHPDCFGQKFVMPLYWRTWLGSGVTRSVTVRGKVLNNNSLVGCDLMVYNSAGTLVSQDSKVFPVTNPASYQDITLNVTQITSSSTSFIVCASIGPLADAHPLMKVDYNP